MGNTLDYVIRNLQPHLHESKKNVQPKNKRKNTNSSLKYKYYPPEKGRFILNEYSAQ